MKLTVNKDELKLKLQIIQSCISKNATTTPILTHVLMRATKEGVSLTGTDMVVALKEPLEAVVTKEGSLSIPAAKFLEIVKEADEDITLEVANGETQLKILFGKCKYKIACLPAADFPLFPVFEIESELVFKSADLIDMLDKTAFSASTTGNDTKSSTLSGLLLNLVPSAKELAVVATDGHRLAIKTKTLDMTAGPERLVILPRKVAMELKKVLASDGDVAVGIGQNHISFTSGQVTFLSRLIEGSYPAWRQVVPVANGKNLTLERAALIKSLRKIGIFSKEGSGSIILETAASHLTLSTTAADVGEAKDEIVATYVGEPIKLGVKTDYLLAVAEKLAGEQITLSFGTPVSPILIKTAGDDLTDHTCVVMPIRL